MGKHVQSRMLACWHSHEGLPEEVRTQEMLHGRPGSCEWYVHALSATGQVATKHSGGGYTTLGT